MRRVVFALILCLVLVPGVFSLSLKSGAHAENAFDSIPMLNAFYDESDDGSMAYWDACTVSLLTISSGDPIYSWFGHAAFLVTTPEGRNITFDYGTFSFDDEDFFVNFAFGRLWFVCCSTYAEYELRAINADGRGVSQVILPLTAAQKKAIIGFLNSNVREENRVYLYHHYRDNCATRLRDIIDRATGGQFKAWAQAQAGSSFRSQASRALSRNHFVLWALDFLQGGNIDRDATLWDEMFLPEILEDAVVRYFGLERTSVDGSTSPFVPMPEKACSNIGFSIIMGLVLGGIGAALVLLGREKAFGIYSGVVEIVFGLLGTLLLFMMVFTNHDVTWMNDNILFVNPVLFVLAVHSFRRSPWARCLSRIILCVIGLLVVLKIVLPGVFVQANWPVIIPVAMFLIPGAVIPSAACGKGSGGQCGARSGVLGGKKPEAHK